MGSRQRHMKKKARNSEMLNIRLSSILAGIQSVLHEAGLPTNQDSLPATIAALVETLQESGSLPSVIVPKTAPVPASTAPAVTTRAGVSLGSVMTPVRPNTVKTRGTSLVDDIDFGIDDDIGTQDESSLDDPSLWELDEIDVPQISATPQMANGQASPTSKPVEVTLDAKSAMAKLQAKLKNAEENGIKRGMPGMGGKPSPLAKGGADKTSIDEQRAIMEKLTGRKQEAPPAGRMKP